MCSKIAKPEIKIENGVAEPPKQAEPEVIDLICFNLIISVFALFLTKKLTKTFPLFSLQHVELEKVELRHLKVSAHLIVLNFQSMKKKICKRKLSVMGWSMNNVR